MSQFLLVIQILLVIVITISVLLQKSSSIGLGAYSGSNESLFGAKGPAGFLAKFTAIIGIIFVLNTIALGYCYQKNSVASVIDNVDTKKISIPKSDINSSLVPTKAPLAPAVPKK